MSEQAAMKPQMHAMAGGSHGLLARTYYRVKPFIPRSIRWMIRRSQVSRQLKESEGVWPILPSSAAPPLGWKGWPDGKQFALVLTHDVESKEGLAKVRDLALLEKRYGYCSSFNFIPAGPYDDPSELRKWLVENGHEVGVHDLNHDGQLFESREGFNKKATLINNFIEEWRAVGFRSGFMLHELDWLHELNVLYDASTFDTDPFEPQPDGSGSIFPFFVKSPAGSKRKGYVELSYTLPQDSTLFLLLREKTPEIWKRKLDWIAKNGGLALVNIHPDYIDFPNHRYSPSSYPQEILQEFFEYCHTQYGDVLWNPLAKDLALWYRNQYDSLAISN